MYSYSYVNNMFDTLGSLVIAWVGHAVYSQLHTDFYTKNLFLLISEGSVICSCSQWVTCLESAMLPSRQEIILYISKKNGCTVHIRYTNLNVLSLPSSPYFFHRQLRVVSLIVPSSLVSVYLFILYELLPFLFITQNFFFYYCITKYTVVFRIS